MKTKSYLVLVLGMVLCLVGWTGYSQRQSSNRQVWEYKTVSTQETHFAGDSTFNEMGAQGWELVAAGNNSVGAPIYIFKRAK